MKEVEITATFRPAPGDWNSLSKTSRGTLETLFQHPLSHNLEWSGMVALFEKLGTVERKPHEELAFSIGDEHRRVRNQHGKDLSATEVMAFRHMLARNGWAPQSAEPKAGAGDSGTPSALSSASTDVLVVMDHHEARLYHLDVRAVDLVDHVIKPYDPHHLLHHLSHKDHPRERGQRTPEDHSFYERIAHAIAQAGAVVLIGHGKGHSNAAHHLSEYLHQHHTETFAKVRRDVVADLSSLTAPQLLDLGRRALTPETPSSSIERPTQ